MKTVLYFAAGVVAGSAATFLVLKEYFEKQAEERIQKEVNSVKETYQKMGTARSLANKNQEKKAQMAAGNDESSSDEGTEKDISDDERDEDLSPEPKNQEKKKIIKDIHKIRYRYNRNVFDDYGNKSHEKLKEFDDEETDNADPSVGSRGGPKEELAEEPYTISADEFVNERRDYDKITIFYYEDDVAVDDQERIVDNLDRLIGIKNVTRLGDLADEDGCVLIRNEMRGSDYEILLQEGTYIPDSIPVRD